ncbi:MAG: polyprenyl synthetase family protein, partial [Pseudomonadota bacterium]
MKDAFKAALGEVAAAVERRIEALLPNGEGPEARLFEAMRYVCLGGGKRLRPFLCVASADLFDVSRERSERAAAAIEMIHCYSLAHDDLPAMDDDDLRRGRPTAHKAFDDATAILAGDALLTFAFEVLAEADTHHEPIVRSELCVALAKAAGAHGMVGGQMIDLMAETRPIQDAEGVTRLQQMKTGALIAVSCEMGAILGRADAAQKQALRGYAHDLGLAFQIADDLLDYQGDEAEVGKRVGK